MVFNKYGFREGCQLHHGAFGIIYAMIVHIYPVFWVKGSISAMIRGAVNYGWERKHHPRWFQELVRKTPD